MNKTLPNTSPKETEVLPDNYISKKLEDWVREEHYRTQGVTVGQLTEYFGLNRNILSEYFMNVSFRDGINDLRIADAKQLLEDKDLTIEQISETVGVSSKSYFCTLFKQR